MNKNQTYLENTSFYASYVIYLAGFVHHALKTGP